jgi:hypothetical protein
MMKNFKLFAIIGGVLVIAVLAGCASMQLESLDTVEGPVRVRQGEDITPSTITLYGIYKDGSRKTVSVSASNITFDKNAVGSQTVRIRVSGQEASFQTEVMALVSVSIGTPPTASILKQGQAAGGWPGLVVQGEWEQMGSHNIPTASLQITGHNSNQVGTQTITASYMGKTASFDVRVVPMTAIRVAQPPTKVDYLQGESLNLAGLRVVGVWEGLPEEQLSVAANEVTGFNSDNGGIQRLTVTKSGITATFEVDVWRLTGISLDAPPDKTTYAVGETLTLSGITVMGNYSGSTTDKRKTEAVPVNQLSATGFNSSAVVRNQRVTVTVRGQTANFFVNIEAAPAVVAPPPAAQQPSQNQPSPVGTWKYDQGGIYRLYTFDANGAGTLAVYARGSTEASGTSNITWSASGNRLTITTSAETMAVTYGINGNIMTWEIEGTTITLTRE